VLFSNFCDPYRGGDVQGHSRAPMLFKMCTLCVFTALHGMQTRSSDENSVSPSVKRVDCDKMEERTV